MNSSITRTSTVGLLITLASVILTCASAAGPPKDGIWFPSATTQSETDEYTRYELLAPETGKFKITYEVTAATAGAATFYNPIRKGSVASDEAVLDAMTGKPLHFEVVSGADARKDPLMPDAEPDTDYIRVTLARPVPVNGQARLVIIKTYEDRKSYYPDGKALVFDRSLGIRRNKIVLPPGYEVVGLTGGRVARGRAQRRRRSPRRSSAAGNRLSKARPRRIASPSARARIATSSTSCSSRSRTPLRSTTTTPNRGPASTATPTSSARAARPAIRRQASSIPVSSSRQRR
jgi:hypothetical protein